MIERLITWDKQIFKAINGLHSPAIDSIMYFMSGTYVWIPFYVLIVFCIIRVFKKKSWVFILGIGLAIACSDRVTSGLMKPYFERQRPTHDPELRESVHTVNNYKGGKFGFASSHAANTFALSTFLWLLFSRYRKWVYVVFGWAVIVTYSRIYLGVHFPGDVIVGAIIGMFFSVLAFRLSERMLLKYYGDPLPRP